MMEIRINNQFRIGSKIGLGASGSVHRGTDLDTNEEVAIKLEYVKTHHSLHLDLELRCYEAVNGEPVEGIPRLRWFGREGDYNILVIDLLGSNLEDLYRDMDRNFTLPTVLKLAGQMITRIETLHRHGFVHCDIKPSNFAVGLGQQKHCIFLFDFGLSKQYIDPRTGKHCTMRRCPYAGTDRYSSINTHLGWAPSRRDDLESLGYTLLYILKGSLPWQNVAGCNAKHKRSRILNAKANVPVEELCKGLPMMLDYINYVRGLKFDDEPDYDYLRRLFWDLFECRGYQWEEDWDWNKPQPKEKDEWTDFPSQSNFNWASSSSWRRLNQGGTGYMKYHRQHHQLEEDVKVRIQQDYLQQLGVPMAEGDAPVIVPLSAETLELLY